MAEPTDRPPARPCVPGAPHHTPRARDDKAAREERLAAELRENLRKRKRQERARKDRPPPET